MQTHNNQNKLLFYFLVFVSFFILIFFAKDYYYTLQENNDILATKQAEVNEKRKTLTDLETLSKKIASKKWAEVSEIGKYVHEIKEDELIDYFYAYVNNNRNWSWYILIDTISFEKWAKNEYGFNEWSVNLSLTVSDETKMLEILDFVTSPNSTYKFFIDNFSFPNDKSGTSFQVNLPLRVFYK